MIRFILFLVVFVLCFASNSVFGQKFEQITFGFDGSEAVAASLAPSVSADGVRITFSSYAWNLVPYDTNSQPDIFVFDVVTGLTSRVSVASDGSEALEGDSYFSMISGDGRYVAFRSAARNLVPRDTNAVYDVFVRDLDLGTTTRVTMSSTGEESDGDSYEFSISFDGRYLAFASRATNLVPDDLNAVSDIFVRDMVLGTTTRVSLDSVGAELFRDSFDPEISGDGRFVTFMTSASLDSQDVNLTKDVYLHDRQNGVTRLVSVTPQGNAGDSGSYDSALSSDGRFVAFDSSASNLTLFPDTNSWIDVFLFDYVSGISERVSLAYDGGESNGMSFFPTISGDGRYVSFWSEATNLVPNDMNNGPDLFVYDRLTRKTERVNRDPLGREVAFDGSSRLSFSYDASSIAFSSQAVILPGDLNSVSDVFLISALSCFSGNVNSGVGLTTDVLFVNGSAGGPQRSVAVPARTSLDLSLITPPFGSGMGRYVMWFWQGVDTFPESLAMGETAVGCTVNPTPLSASAPQPFACLSGRVSSQMYCGATHRLPSPPTVPWQVRRGNGLREPLLVTIQGVVEDVGSANSTGFSVTNAVRLQVY